MDGFKNRIESSQVPFHGLKDSSRMGSTWNPLCVFWSEWIILDHLKSALSDPFSLTADLLVANRRFLVIISIHYDFYSNSLFTEADYNVCVCVCSAV